MNYTQAYRGYLITHNVVYNTFYIRKDGHHIGSEQTLEAAKTAIDTLKGDE